MEKIPVPADVQAEARAKLPPPLAYTIDTEMPKRLVLEIEVMLSLARHTLQQGGEVPLTFIGVDANFDSHALDIDGCPRPLVRSLLTHFCDQADIKVICMMTEAYSLPQEHRQAIMDTAPADRPDISKMPEAIEVFAMTIETELGTWMAELPLLVKATENDDGPSRVPEGVLEFTKGVKGEGRFANLLACNRGEPEPGDRLGILLARLMGAMQTGECDCAKCTAERASDAANDTTKSEGEASNG